MMNFENKGKWMKQILESAELDSPENEEMALDLDESAQVNEDEKGDFIKDIKEIIRYVNAGYGKVSDNKKKMDFWSKKYTATYNALKPFSLSNLSNGSYKVEVSANNLDFDALKEQFNKAVKSTGLKKTRTLGDVGNKYFIYESIQVNEDNPYEKEWHEYVNGIKGSFMKHLANAFQQADMNNLRKLHSAFPEVSKKFWLWRTAGKQDKP